MLELFPEARMELPLEVESELYQQIVSELRLMGNPTESGTKSGTL